MSQFQTYSDVGPSNSSISCAYLPHSITNSIKYNSQQKGTLIDQERSEIVSQKLQESSREKGSWSLRHFESMLAAFWKGKLMFHHPTPKSLVPETIIWLVMETSCAQTTVGTFPVFLESADVRAGDLPSSTRAWHLRGVIFVPVHLSPPTCSHTVGPHGPFPSLFSWFPLFEVVTVYKVTTDVELVNSEPLFLGEIQGCVPESLWSRFHQYINT